MSRNDRSPLLDGILDEIQSLGPFASIDEINRRLADQAHAYNTRPQADLGGLSPLQMGELLEGDWSTTGALRLDASLSFEDVGNAPLLADARTLLQFVVDHGPIKETSAGNLPRRVVQALLPQLRTAALDQYERPPTVNEGDVLWLLVLRHTLLFARLLVRRRGVTASTSGRSLLEERRAGELYALLFRTFFRSFDLGFLDNSDRHPGLQPTVAYTFYRLQTEARDWSSPQSLAEHAWHPDTKDPPTASDLQYGDSRHWSFTHRVVTPLVHFGLMERRVVEPEARWKEHEYRISPLFNRFIRFQFGRQQNPTVP
jgi:hypothetical protein